MPGGGPIRVLLCDDHRILSDAFAMLIRSDPGLELVCDPVDTAEQAVAAATQHEPHVVLMDVQLKGETTGLEATRQIKAMCPWTNVVVMSGSGDPDRLLVEAVEVGASGFLPKTEAAGRVLEAIQAAARGESLLDSATLTRVLHRVAARRGAQREMAELTARLTDREREVLQLLAQGLSNDQVAAKLYISPQTVQTHIRNVLSKLRVHSKLEAVALAAKAGAIAV